MSDRYDIIICGAGPTGLILALTLALSPSPPKFLLLNKQLSRSTHSRAWVVWPRNAESLYRLSPELFERMRAMVRYATAINLSFGPTRTCRAPMSSLINPEPLSPAPTPWVLPQYVMESVLEQYLTQHMPEESSYMIGHSLHSFVNVADSPDNPITASIKNEGSGEIREISCRFLIGCDGLKSTVRALAGICVVTKPDTYVGWLADVRFEKSDDDRDTSAGSSPISSAPLSPQQSLIPSENDSLLGGLTILTTKNKGGMAMIPIDNRIHRLVIPYLYIMDAKKGTTGTTHDFALEQPSPHLLPKATSHIEAYARDLIAPYKLRLKDVLVTSEYHFSFGVAETYFKDNVVLAGDAVHQHSAAGGQGMNLGMQDAFDLGWRLRLLTQFPSDEHARALLLESYEAERLPIAQEVVEKTRKVSGFIFMKGGDVPATVQPAGFRKRLWFRFISFLVSLLFSTVFPKLIGSLMQLGYTYRKSPISRSNVLRRRGVEPGDFFPCSSVVVRSDQVSNDVRKVEHVAGSPYMTVELSSLLTFKGFMLVFFPSRQIIKGLNSLMKSGAVDLHECLLQLDSEWYRFVDACSDNAVLSRLVTQTIVLCDFGARAHGEEHQKLRMLKSGPFGIQYVQDEDARKKHKCGGRKSLAYFIRPDGFIGYKGEPFKCELALNYLGQFVEQGVLTRE